MSSTSHTSSRASRTKGAARLLFPGVVAICLSIPSLVPGALAFDMKRDFAFNAAEIGAVVAAFYLLSSISTQFSMPLLSRFSPMAMARTGLLLTASGLLVAAALGNKPGLWWLCLVGGLANGMATPSANMLIALTVPVRRRGLAFGLRVSAVPASAAITAVGAYVVAHSAVGWRALSMALALLLVVVCAASFAGSSTRVRPPAQTAAEERGEGLISLRLIALGGLLAATACSTLSPFLVEGLIAGGAHPGDAALLLGASAGLGVVGRASAGVMADKFPHPLTHLASASLMLVAAAVGMFGLGFGNGTPVLATATLLTFGIGWAWPGLLHHATITLHPGHMAKATSQMQMGTFVGALLGPLGFGFLVELGSYRLAWSTAAGVALFACLTIVLGRQRAAGPTR